MGQPELYFTLFFKLLTCALPFSYHIFSKLFTNTSKASCLQFNLWSAQHRKTSDQSQPSNFRQWVHIWGHCGEYCRKTSNILPNVCCVFVVSTEPLGWGRMQFLYRKVHLNLCGVFTFHHCTVTPITSYLFIPRHLGSRGWQIYVFRFINLSMPKAQDKL